MKQKLKLTIKICTIYLTREDALKLTHLSFLFENEIVQEKMKEYIDENTPLYVDEGELSNMMRILDTNDSNKVLRSYLQKAGNNIFNW